jgi:hypothetical protein
MVALDAVQKIEKSLACAGNRTTIPWFSIPLSGPFMLVKLQTSGKLRFLRICCW